MFTIRYTYSTIPSLILHNYLTYRTSYCTQGLDFQITDS